MYKIKQDAVSHKHHTVHFDRLKPYVLQECGVKPKEGEAEEDELDMMVLLLQGPQEATPPSAHVDGEEPITLGMMEKLWNLLQRQMSKPKILPHLLTIYVDQPVRDGLLKDWEPEEHYICAHPHYNLLYTCHRCAMTNISFNALANHLQQYQYISHERFLGGLLW